MYTYPISQTFALSFITLPTALASFSVIYIDYYERHPDYHQLPINGLSKSEKQYQNEHAHKIILSSKCYHQILIDCL